MGRGREYFEFFQTSGKIFVEMRKRLNCTHVERCPAKARVEGGEHTPEKKKNQRLALTRKGKEKKRWTVKECCTPASARGTREQENGGHRKGQKEFSTGSCRTHVEKNGGQTRVTGAKNSCRREGHHLDRSLTSREALRRRPGGTSKEKRGGIRGSISYPLGETLWKALASRPVSRQGGAGQGKVLN